MNNLQPIKKSTHFLLVLVLLISSCSEREEEKQNLLHSKDNRDALYNDNKNEFIDEKTQKERTIDSLHFFNSIEFTKVIKNAPLIDSKKIGNTSFNNLDFNRVVAYAYDGTHERIKITKLNISAKAEFHNIDQQKGLSQSQVNYILNFFSKSSTYDLKSFGCFEPHFALVLYKDTMAVSQISVCMDCNNVYTEPNILKRNHGLSQKGRNGIISFCKELNFPYGELKQ